MTNKLQQAFTALNKNFYKNSRQRREAIAKAQAILAQGEDLLTAAIFFVVFILPFLFNPNLLFNLSAWLWWVKGHAWMGLLVWILHRLLVAIPLAPAQLTGATVDAMEQAALTDDILVFFPTEPVEVECEPLSQPPAPAEQKVGRQAYWLKQWRRPDRKLLFGLLIRRHLPFPPLSLKPSA